MGSRRFEAPIAGSKRRCARPAAQTHGPRLGPVFECSRDIVRRTRCLRDETRGRIAGNRRLLNPWWGVSGGSDGPGGDGLRLRVRQRLERGDLIPVPKRVWGARGTGSTCAICSKAIMPDEVENKIVIWSEGVMVRLWAHLPCLRLWREESDALERRTRATAEDSSMEPPISAV